MNKEKAILIRYNYIDSQDTWRNMTPTSFLLFRNIKDAKDYVFKMYKVNEWHENWPGQEFIKIWPDRKNQPNDYIMYNIICREVLTKAKIAELLAPKKSY